jgi:hypothetical protein
VAQSAISLDYAESQLILDDLARLFEPATSDVQTSHPNGRGIGHAARSERQKNGARRGGSARALKSLITIVRSCSSGFC